MSEAISTEKTRLNRAADAILSPGRALFSLAIIALGIETLVCARSAIFLYSQGSNPRFKVMIASGGTAAARAVCVARIER